MDPDDQTQQGIPDDGDSNANPMTSGGPAPASMGADSQMAIPDSGPAGNNPISTAGEAVGGALRAVGGAGQAMQQQPQPGQEDQGVKPGTQYFPGQQRIASLLMGKGATPPDQAQAMADEFKKQGANDDQANMLAVVQAGKQGGQPAEFSMVQYNRVAANAKFAFANAAFNGTDGKPADINAAAIAATQASAHILDGTSASFHVDGRGVTATVTDNDGKKTSYDMTKDQFGHFLDLSGPSQYDRLMQTGGIAGAMQQIGAIQQNGTSGKSDGGESAPAEDQSKAAPGATDATTTAKAKPQSDDDADYRQGEDRLLEEGNKRFPWISQGAQRNAWIAQERGRRESNENAVEVAQEKGKLANERARITGSARVQAADTSGQHKENIATGNRGVKSRELDIKQGRLLLDQASRQNNEQGRMIGRILASKPDATVDDVNAELKGFNMPPLVTQPQAPAAQAPVVRGNQAQKADTGSSLPPGAIDMLRKNPQLAAQFDAKYGPGSAEAALGQ